MFGPFHGKSSRSIRRHPVLQIVATATHKQKSNISGYSGRHFGSPLKTGDEALSLAANAKEVYESKFKARLETDHLEEFVAIEPVSKSCFLGDYVY
jgi:hypothetical protein